MNKILMGACLCAGLCGVFAPVYGATVAPMKKCVALNSSSTTCTASPAGGKLDWNASCTTNGKTIAISGIAGCSSQSGSVGDKADSIITSSTSDDNRYCWCKMTSPAVSSWVFAHGSPSAGDCANACAHFCAYGVQAYADFRSALFNSVSKMPN